jgi:deoxycytidylate deaminase
MTELSNRDSKFLGMAHEEAYKSPCYRRHGCVAVIQGRVVGKGYNHYRCSTSDGFVQNSCTCHAEMSAIRQVYRSHEQTHTRYENSIKVA